METPVGNDANVGKVGLWVETGLNTGVGASERDQHELEEAMESLGFDGQVVVVPSEISEKSPIKHRKDVVAGQVQEWLEADSENQAAMIFTSLGAYEGQETIQALRDLYKDKSDADFRQEVGERLHIFLLAPLDVGDWGQLRETAKGVVRVVNTHAPGPKAVRDRLAFVEVSHVAPIPGLDAEAYGKLMRRAFPADSALQRYIDQEKGDEINQLIRLSETVFKGYPEDRQAEMNTWSKERRSEYEVLEKQLQDWESIESLDELHEKLRLYTQYWIHLMDNIYKGNDQMTQRYLADKKSLVEDLVTEDKNRWYSMLWQGLRILTSRSPVGKMQEAVEKQGMSLTYLVPEFDVVYPLERVVQKARQLKGKAKVIVLSGQAHTSSWYGEIGIAGAIALVLGVRTGEQLKARGLYIGTGKSES